MRHLLKRQFPGEIAEGDGECQAVPSPPECHVDALSGRLQRQLGGSFCASCKKPVDKFGARVDSIAQEGRMSARALHGFRSGVWRTIANHCLLFTVSPTIPTQLPLPVGRLHCR
jgi:hypothetical protein